MPTLNAVRPGPARYPRGEDVIATEGGARVPEDEGADQGEARDLFTTTEAAAQLGITQGAVKAAITVGTLKAVRINPRLNMVTAAAIEEYRREHLRRQGRPRGSRNRPKGEGEHDAGDDA